MKNCITILAFLCLLGPVSLFAQRTFQVDAPIKIDNTTMRQTRWTAEVLDEPPYAKNSTVQIRFTAELLDKDWHLYSAIESESFTYMPTEFYLNPDESRNVELEGKMSDEQKAVEEQDDVMGGVIRYFNDHKVSFTQTFRVTGKKAVLAGEITGQLCKAPSSGGQCIRLLVPVKWTIPTP